MPVLTTKAYQLFQASSGWFLAGLEKKQMTSKLWAGKAKWL